MLVALNALNLKKRKVLRVKNARLIDEATKPLSTRR